LQISWLILLAGAEIAFELENDLFIPSRTSTPLSHKAAALLITYRCIEAFAKGNSPLTDRTLAHELGMSLNHLHTLLEALQNENILVAITNKDQIIGYQPAKAIEFITFAKVCQAIDKNNELIVSVKDSIPLSKIQNFLEEADFSLETSVQNQPLYPTLSS
jgi:membrane protein